MKESLIHFGFELLVFICFLDFVIWNFECFEAHCFKILSPPGTSGEPS